MSDQQSTPTTTPADDLARIHELSDKIVDMFRALMVRVPVNGEMKIIPPRNWMPFDRDELGDFLEDALQVFNEDFRERRALCLKLGIGRLNHTNDVIIPRSTNLGTIQQVDRV